MAEEKLCNFRRMDVGILLMSVFGKQLQSMVVNNEW